MHLQNSGNSYEIVADPFGLRNRKPETAHCESVPVGNHNLNLGNGYLWIELNFPWNGQSIQNSAKAVSMVWHRS